MDLRGEKSRTFYINTAEVKHKKNQPQNNVTDKAED